MSTMTMPPTTLDTGMPGGEVGGAFGTGSAPFNDAQVAQGLQVVGFELEFALMAAQLMSAAAQQAGAAAPNGTGGPSAAASSPGGWPGSSGNGTSLPPLENSSALSSLPAIMQAVMAVMRGGGTSPDAGNAPMPPAPAAPAPAAPAPAAPAAPGSAAQPPAGVAPSPAPSPGAPGAPNAGSQPDAGAGGSSGGGASGSGGDGASGGGGASGNGVGASATAGPPPNSIDALSLGVKNDGSTDDTASLNAAIQTANAQGKTLYLPAGTYDHSGEVIDDGGSLAGAGSGTNLKATNQDQSALEMTGNNTSLSQMTVTAPYSERSSQPGAAAVLFQDANNASFSNLTAIGGASNSIRFADSQNSTGTRILTEDSGGDGVANTANSSNNKITQSELEQAGDDEDSDDDYADQPGRDENNSIDGSLIGNNPFGGGVAFEGGVADEASNNVIENTPGSSIRAGTDPNSGTKTGSGDTFSNNVSIGSGAPPFAVNGMSENNDVTATDAAAAEAKLGFTPVSIADLVPRSAVDGGYQAGTEAGSHNTAGNRT